MLSSKVKCWLGLFHLLKGNDHQGALQKWREIDKFIPLLFKEPNPGPVKYCLHRLNLIQSSEIRLPLTDISKALKRDLDKIINV